MRRSNRPCMHEPSHRHPSHLYVRPSRRVCVRGSAPCVGACCHLVGGGGRRARRSRGEEGRSLLCCLHLHLHAWKPKGGQLLPESPSVVREYVIEPKRACSGDAMCEGIGRRILSALEEASHACIFVSGRPALRESNKGREGDCCILLHGATAAEC
jgi:hypothetical protein